VDLLHFLTAAVFLAASLVALVAANVLPRGARTFARIVGAACLLLALEKLLRLLDRAHEGLHRAGVPDPPLLSGIDDLFLLAGFAVAAIVVRLFWQTLTSDAWLAAAAAASASLAGLSFVIDAFGPPGGTITVVEEGLEMLSAAGILGVAVRLRSLGLSAAGMVTRLPASNPGRAMDPGR
jgi:hypothetical protein